MSTTTDGKPSSTADTAFREELRAFLEMGLALLSGNPAPAAAPRPWRQLAS
jgi:hypothetical protein